jgi:hypothetical protein
MSAGSAKEIARAALGAARIHARALVDIWFRAFAVDALGVVAFIGAQRR